MMKLLAVLVFVLCLPFVVADSFNTKINVTTLDGYVSVGTEGGLYSNIDCNISGTNEYLILLEREVSCAEEVYCESAIQNISEYARLSYDSLKRCDAYYDLYTECYGNLSATAKELESVSKDADFKDDYDQCKLDLSRAVSDKNKFNAENTACGLELVASNKDRDKAKENTWLFVAGAALLSGGGVYWFMGRKKAPAKHPLEQDYPDRR